MSDDNNITPTPLDNIVSANEQAPAPIPEQYSKDTEGAHIADKPSPPQADNAPQQSWALREIERAVARDVLPVSRQKLVNFADMQDRRNDFRLRSLTQRLDNQTRREFDRTTPGRGGAHRHSALEIRSHSLRMIATNATLGSFQFQKNQVLPYMRKNLALGYQKANLLKAISTGITGMERSVVAKLEAIKLNTAAGAPKSIGMITRLRNQVRDKQYDRVATNISNLILERKAAAWDKYASPLLRDVNKGIAKEGRDGGVNGAGRVITKKLDDLRQQTKNSSNPLARGASRILGGAVGITQRARLPSFINGIVSGPLRIGSDMATKLNPFSATQLQKDDLEELGEDITKATKGGGGNLAAPQFNTLINVLMGWRGDQKRQSLAIEDRLTGIYNQMKSGGTLGLPLGKSSSPVSNTNLTPAQRQVTTRIGNIFRYGKASSQSTFAGFNGPAGWSKLVPQVASVNFQTGQAVQTSMFGEMVSQLAGIRQSIDVGNKARSFYETAQIKRQTLTDRLSARLGIRRGSYEDLLARGKKTAGAGLSRAKDTAADVAERVRSGMDAEDADSESGGFDWSSLTDLFDGEKESGGKIRGAGRRMRGRLRGGLRRSGRGFKGLFKRGLSGAGRGAGRGMKGLLKLGGKGLWRGGIKGANLLARGGLKIAGSGIGIGALIGLGRSALDNSSLDDNTKHGADTLMSMAEYGSMGSVFGPWGTAIGAAVGGVVANTDYFSAGLGAMGDSLSGAASGIWSTLVGRKAQIRPDGSIVREYKSSLLENVESFFFGRKARLGPNGQVIVPERGNLLSNIQYGFEKTFFGDRFSNGEFAGGTSLIEEARNGLAAGILDFKKQLVNLPSQIAKDFKGSPIKKFGDWLDKATYDSAQSTKKNFLNSMKTTGQNIGNFNNRLMAVQNSAVNVNWREQMRNIAKNPGKVASIIGNLTLMLTPGGFAQGFSNATMGWFASSEKYKDPANPQYRYVGLVLEAYGLKNRELFKFVQSMQTSQEKINNRQIPDFDDKDMKFMATNFGFDGKSDDAVNYFKMWFTRRFKPAMVTIQAVLKSRNLTFDSVLSLGDEELIKLNGDLQKEIANSGVTRLGLEPTPQAYNRYAKIGAQDPTKTGGAAGTPTKPYVPRDPSNRQSAADQGSQGNPYLSYNRNANPNSGFGPSRDGSMGYDQESDMVVGRVKAKIVKGQVTDQPDYRKAFQKLPPNVQKVVAKSRPLQFVLWSTAIQHGPEKAALIFQRDYATDVDDDGYIRTIYQDRAREFDKLKSTDRANATAWLSKEQNFAFGIENGTSDTTGRGLMGIVGDRIDPNGNYHLDPSAASMQPGPGLMQLVPAAQAAQRKYGVPASITLAQYQLESGGGRHMPAGSNNPFGVKAVGNQPYVLARTSEQTKGGQSYSITARFRKYGSIQEAVEDHGRLLATSPRYRRAQQYSDNPVMYARALQGVYATDVNYANKLIGIMRQRGLTKFDGGEAPQTQSPGGNTPAKQSTPQKAPVARPQKKPAAAPSKPYQPVSASGAMYTDPKLIAAMEANTAAMHANAKAYSGKGPLKPGATNVIAPTIMGGQQGGSGLAMHLAQVARNTGK